MKFLKEIILIGCLGVATLVQAAEVKKIFISKVVDHPAINRTTDGIIDVLKENGYNVNENLQLRIESAQSSPVLAQQIANKFINQGSDIIVAVGTIPAQSFIKEAIGGKIKLIFSSVTDPIGAGLIKNLEKPGRNISGVSNFVDPEPQLKLFKTLQPNLKRLGIIYNPGDPNSVSIIKRLEALCPKLRITLVKQTINKTSEAAQSAVALAQTSEAIYISNDNTALSALQSIIKVSNNSKTPVYVSDTDAVALGAVAALGPNQYDVGRQTGKMIVRILKGNDIKTEPVEFVSKTELYLNLEAANKLGMKIPENILRSAKQIIKKD